MYVYAPMVLGNVVPVIESEAGNGVLSTCRADRKCWCDGSCRDLRKVTLPAGPVLDGGKRPGQRWRHERSERRSLNEGFG